MEERTSALWSAHERTTARPSAQTSSQVAGLEQREQRGDVLTMGLDRGGTHHLDKNAWISRLRAITSRRGAPQRMSLSSLRPACSPLS